MRVLIDCTQITQKKAGVGIYALNLINELCKRQDDTFKVNLLVQDDDPCFSTNSMRAHSVVTIPAKYFRKLPLRFLMEQIYIPLLAAKHRVDIVHSLHYSFPLLPTRIRKVVTIHDMTFFLMPEVHTRFKRIYFRFFIRAAAYLSSSLIFVSKSTQADLMAYFPKYRKPGFITPLGKSSSFRPDLEPQKVGRVLEKYNLSKPYILYIGTIEPRKNLVRLVTAFSQIAQSFPHHTLVIAGMKGWMYEELFATVTRLEMEKRVVFTGYVEEEDKPYLIAGCEAFVYPSLYEGFGIPVLEALACGAAVLTSDKSSLPEVAGDAALLVNPTSVDSITQNLEMLLSDLSIRMSLHEKSLRQASLFDWRFTADRTIEAYRALSKDTP